MTGYKKMHKKLENQQKTRDNPTFNQNLILYAGVKKVQKHHEPHEKFQKISHNKFTQNNF